MAPPSPSPSTPPSADPARSCRLCGTPLADRKEGIDGSERCPACGLHEATDVARDARWQLIGGMAVVYAVVALLVLLTR